MKEKCKSKKRVIGVDPFLFIILNTVPISYAHISNSTGKSVSFNWSKIAHS